MPLYAVSYQLNHEKNYQPLWDELNRLGGHKVMRSFWFLDVTSPTPRALRDHLRDFIDDDDAVCIVPMGEQPSHYRGYKGTNDWIAARF